MDLILSNDSCAVFDNVLSPTEFNDLQRFFRRQTFNFLQSTHWVKRLGFGSERALQSKVYVEKPFPPLFCDVCPPDSPLAVYFQRINENASQFSPWIGERGRQWDYFAVSSFIHPSGNSLPWHEDAYGARGSFTFYAHPKWDAFWGGELLIGKKMNPGEGKNLWDELPFSTEFASEALMREGHGLFVLPKPNRLILLGPGVPHAMKSVSSGAGDILRCSLTAFIQSERDQFEIVSKFESPSGRHD